MHKLTLSVGLDPELRLHRIESKPGLTTLSGDVVEGDRSSHSGSHAEKASRSAEGNELAGGGRVDP